MKQRLFFICIIFLFFSKINLSAQESLAEINIKLQNTYYEVPKTLYGGFIEFLLDVVDGMKGLHAQELTNRGFDFNDCWSLGTSCMWSPWTDTMELSLPDYYLHDGGVNPRGLYYQEIKQKGERGSTGLSQRIYIADNVSHEFYIYMKGDTSVGELYLSFRDTLSGKIYYETSLGTPTNDWKKVTKIIPILPDARLCLIVLRIKRKGSIFLDEASLMPTNNMYGVRKELYDFFKEWSPGIIRYPGGWIADCSVTDWKDGIGQIDERTSPKLLAWGDSQRMDFGTDEFIAFCKDIGAEPHMVLPFMYFEPGYVAGWIEYCNGDTSTTYGKLRAQYGHKEPYNIKYWEVGNEQWDNAANMSSRYNYFFQPLKDKDSTIKLIMCGNFWGGYPFFDTCITTTASNMEIYGWHWAEGFSPSKINNDTVVLLNVMGLVHNLDIEMYVIDDWIKDKGYDGKIKQGITELFMYFEGGWYYKPYSFNLLTGLWNAFDFNVYTRHTRTTDIAETSYYTDFFNFGFNASGQRVWIASPSYYALVMMTNHHGNFLIPSEVNCENYNTPFIQDVWPINDVPYLDVTTTASKDTLFLSVVNIHPTKQVKAKLKFNFNYSGSVAKVYELNSPSLTDVNTPDKPNFIVPLINLWNVTDTYFFPPHSYTIIAIPCSAIVDVQDNELKSEFLITNISPNPAQDFIKINSNIDDFSIKIINELGIKFSEQKINGKTVDIDTKNYPTGTYFCIIKSGSRVETKKFVIIR